MATAQALTDGARRRQAARRAGWGATLALACLLSLLPGAPDLASAQGRPLRLEGLQGGTLGPTDLSQSVVIAVVWASWSPRCRDIVQRVNSIAERWGDRARVIMVDFQEDRAEVEAFLSRQRPRVPVFLDRDGAFSKKYSVTNLPGLVILKDGNTVFSGKLPANPDSLIAQSLG